MSEKYKFHDPEGIYFVTPTIIDWIDLFTKKQYCDIIIESLIHCQIKKNLLIHAWCIMTSHLHLIISGCNGDLSGVIRDFKKYTSIALLNVLHSGIDSRREWILKLSMQKAKAISRNKKNKIWQDGNHPVLLDNNDMVETRLNYLHQNPVEAGIVTEPEHYYYSSAIDYAGGKGLIDVVLLQ